MSTNSSSNILLTSFFGSGHGQGVVIGVGVMTVGVSVIPAESVGVASAVGGVAAIANVGIPTIAADDGSTPKPGDHC